MIKKKSLLALINIVILAGGLAVILLVFTNSKKSPDRKEQVVNQLTYLALKQIHYHPKAFDDSLSVEIFNETIKNFDPGKRFFTKSDIENLAIYKYLIDDLIRNSNFSFLDAVISTYQSRYKQVKHFYKEILSRPFDFSKDEMLQLDPDKIDYAKDTNELKDRWRKILKYETLMKLNTYLNNQEKARKKSDTVKIKSVTELEAKARKEVMKQYDSWFEFMDKLNRQDWFALYMNSITAVFDPHTEYMPPKQKEDFDIYMSGKLEGIGATLQYKDGEIKVVKIIPGGAAWREGELEAGDVILKVAQGDKPPVSIVGWRLDDAVRLIRGPKGTKVRLTVRKVDGTIKEISIIRDVVIIEDTYARSVILSKPGSKYRFGYIYFPSFYADFQHPNGRRVYKDVEKELAKLKKDNVDGIIIDLRNNGGGSLDDVIKIVGLFINKGPVVQVRDRKGNVRVYEDPEEKITYSGPLLVMVNELSASASEIFAAAIQDYHRGIIMGAKHTHGKGTVQNIMNYDDFVTDNSLKPLGALKITIQKFYRINGGSTQLKGVTSDIIVPTPFMFIKSGERELDYPLPWDQIKPAKYHLWHPKYNLRKVRERSEKRIARDSVFRIITEYARSLKNSRDSSLVSLNLEKYRKEQKLRQQRNKPYNRIRKTDKNIIINFLPQDKQRFATDTLAKIRYEDWAKNLKKDLYLPEALNILTDMVR